MANNIAVTEGSGKTVATEDIGSVQYQKIKIVDGTVGSSTALKVNADGSITASVYGAITVTPAANQSVSGTIGASVIGTVPITQGGPLVASVSGQVGASIVGTVPVVQSGTVITSVSGVVNVAGSVVAFLTGNPSISGTVNIIGGNSSIIAVVQSSIAVAIVSGSIAASFTPPANQSVSGTVGASIIGLVPIIGSVSGDVGSSIIGVGIANQADGATSLNQLMVDSRTRVYNGSNWDRLRGNSSIGALVSTGASSVITVQGTSPWIITGSVQASLTPAANQSVSGTVGASIIGQLPAGTAVLGSVAALQGTNPWIVTSSIAGGLFPITGSVAATITNTNVNVSGSVVAFQGAGWSGSVFAIVQGQQGASVSGTVNIGGVANIAGSVAAFLPPYSASTQGITSVMTGTTSVLVLAAPGGTNRNYITHVLVTNGGSTSTTVTIQDGASILWGGYAAAGGGWSENFNPPLPQPTSVKALYATSSVQSSVIVAINGFTGV